MKKIVPFNNILTFNTDVCEITAISLEHNIEIDSDVISGEFYISGEYKMTDGQLEKEEFNFELPFDIALGSNYDNDSLIIDIDDFRYELIERNKLKVNIDLFIDGEILESINEKEPIVIDTLPNLEEISPRKEESFGVKESSRCLSEEDINKEEKIEINNEEENPEYDEPIQMPITEDLDLLNEMLENNKENVMKEEKNTNNNINTDISNPEVVILVVLYNPTGEGGHQGGAWVVLTTHQKTI